MSCNANAAAVSEPRGAGPTSASSLAGSHPVVHPRVTVDVAPRSDNGQCESGSRATRPAIAAAAAPTGAVRGVSGEQAAETNATRERPAPPGTATGRDALGDDSLGGHAGAGDASNASSQHSVEEQEWARRRVVIEQQRQAARAEREARRRQRRAEQSAAAREAAADLAERQQGMREEARRWLALLLPPHMPLRSALSLLSFGTVPANDAGLRKALRKARAFFHPDAARRRGLSERETIKAEEIYKARATGSAAARVPGLRVQSSVCALHRCDDLSCSSTRRHVSR